MTQEKEEKQILFLDFFEGKKGTPIARTPEGKICLLNFNNCKRNRVYVHSGEQWKCEVDIEEEKKLIVTPINMTLDAKESEYFAVEKAKLLKDKYPRKNLL